MQTMPYRIALHWDAVAGRGACTLMPQLCRERGWSRLWVLLDPRVAAVPRVETMLSDWASQDLEVFRSSGPGREPTYDDLERLRSGGPAHPADVVVGVGGGSTMDTAKGLAVLATNGGPALGYRGFERFTNQPLPNVAIPTIAGSGSEVTPNASFVDAGTSKKLGINGAAVKPALAILDPELTCSAPLALTLASGFDALVHAVEAYVSRRATPIARSLAVTAVTRVSRALLDIKRESEPNLDAREDLLMGAAYAAFAMGASGAGAAAALSYPASTRLGLSHGLAGAVFLPPVVALNVSRGVNTYAELAACLPADRDLGLATQLPGTDQALLFATGLRRLRDLLGLQPPISAIPDDSILDAMCADLDDLRGALDSNPAPVTAEDARRIFIEVLGAPSVPLSPAVPS